MCIIIAKNKSDRLPTIEELKNSFEYNSDGAGFMYVDKGQVVIDKGYMQEGLFIKRFEELCKTYNNFDNKCLVIHCRIGTSSSNTAPNTHPYPVTYKERELHKAHFTCDLGMAHNGIIHDYTPTWSKPTTNDTQEFILKYVYPLYSKWHDFYKNRFILEGLQKVTNSKLAFLDKDDNLYLVGDFTEDNNLMFSNTSYKSYRYSNTYTNNGYNWKNWEYESGYDNYANKIEEEDDYVKLENPYSRPRDYDWTYDYWYNLEEDEYDYTKIYLHKGYKVRYSDGTYMTINSDEEEFVWDYETGELFEITSTYDLALVDINVDVLDENNEELI